MPLQKSQFHPIVIASAESDHENLRDLDNAMDINNNESVKIKEIDLVLETWNSRFLQEQGKLAWITIFRETKFTGCRFIILAFRKKRWKKKYQK